jgi:hypothetical protein
MVAQSLFVKLRSLFPDSDQGRRGMSLQIGVMRILASHPDGRATTQSIKSDLNILAGQDWSETLQRLGKHAAGLNIFASQLVQLDRDGWEITEAGRAYLDDLEERLALTP